MSLRTLELGQKLQTALHAKASCFLREPCAGNPHARFDKRGVETGHGAANETPADERAGNS